MQLVDVPPADEVIGAVTEEAFDLRDLETVE
jgi:hypothetical protein